MKIKNSVRRRFCHTQELKFSPERVFPLLCPVREYDWIENWKCEMIYSDSGYAEENCIFTTVFPDDGSEDVWVVSNYKPPRDIHFVRTNRLRVIRYNIALTANDDGTSSAEWEQILTGLNEEGNRFVEEQSEDAFNQMVDSLGFMIDYYLENGRMLKLG